MLWLWLSLLWLTAAAVEQPEAEVRRLNFSHRLHLQDLGLQCEDCHSLIPTSTTAEDLNFPSEESCARCHDVTGPDTCGTCHLKPAAASPRANRLINLRFSHQQHLSLEAVLAGAPPDARSDEDGPSTCSLCHQGLRETELTGLAHYPAMSDCLKCHQPRADAMRECRTCHPDTRNLMPESHVDAGFFDDHSQTVKALGVDGCRMCHTPGYNPCSQCH